jgi:AraC-like DNA-binding protein
MRRLRGKFSGVQAQEGKIMDIEIKSYNDQLMDRIVKAINENISDSEFKVDQLCAQVGISRSQLHRKIKEIAGIPTADFIRNIRLNQAARLLREHKASVADVAYNTGFANQTHFSTVFKKYFGMSPSDYADAEDTN